MVLQTEKSSDPHPKWAKEDRFDPAHPENAIQFLDLLKETLEAKTRTLNITTTQQVVDWCSAGLAPYGCSDFKKARKAKWLSSTDPHLRFVREFLSDLVPTFHCHNPWFSFLQSFRSVTLTTVQQTHAWVSQLRVKRVGVPPDYWADAAMCLELQGRLPAFIRDAVSVTEPQHFDG